jgi:hypothetical protein
MKNLSLLLAMSLLLVCMAMIGSAIAKEIDIDPIGVPQNLIITVTGTCHDIEPGQYVWIFVCRPGSSQGSPFRPIIDINNWKIFIPTNNRIGYFNIIALLVDETANEIIENCNELECPIPGNVVEADRIQIQLD